MEIFTGRHSETIERIKRVQNTWSHLTGALKGAETSLSSFKGKSPREINTHGSALDDMLSAIVHKTGEKKYVPNDHQFGHMYKKENFILVCLKPHASAVCFIFGMVVG